MHSFYEKSLDSKEKLGKKEKEALTRLLPPLLDKVNHALYLKYLFLYVSFQDGPRFLGWVIIRFEVVKIKHLTFCNQKKLIK